MPDILSPQKNDFCMEIYPTNAVDCRIFGPFLNDVDCCIIFWCCMRVVASMCECWGHISNPIFAEVGTATKTCHLAAALLHQPSLLTSTIEIRWMDCHSSLPDSVYAAGGGGEVCMHQRFLIEQAGVVQRILRHKPLQ